MLSTKPKKKRQEAETRRQHTVYYYYYHYVIIPVVPNIYQVRIITVTTILIVKRSYTTKNHTQRKETIQHLAIIVVLPFNITIIVVNYYTKYLIYHQPKA